MELADLGETAQGVEWREHQTEETEITYENFIIRGFFGDVILRSVERTRAQPGRSVRSRRGHQSDPSGSDRRAHAVPLR